MTANAEPPVAAPPGAVPPVIAPPLRDRGGFLIFLGIIEIAVGALCALFGLMMLAATTLMKPPGAALPPMQRAGVAFNLLFYLGSAVFMVVVGLGTIRVRRWARVLMLIVSWSFLVAAIFGIVMMGFLLPDILGRMDPGSADPAAVRTVLFFVMALVAGTMIGMPLFFVLAYSGRHVRHTFATRHPEPTWVDRCPSSILAMSLVMALFGLSQISGSWTGLSVLFGVALSGPAAIAVNLVIGGSWIGLGFGLFRLSRAAWLAGFVFIAVVHVSAFFAFRSMSFIEMFYRLGAGAGDVSAIGGLGSLLEHWSGAFALASGAVWIVSLFSVRRHFR